MLPSIAQLASKHGIIPLKKYGQNFIFDETLCDKIVKNSALKPGSTVLEIGPGPAGLTRSILKASPAGLIVIETDRRCIPLLNEISLHFPSIKIIHDDALKIKLTDLRKGLPDKIDIISNLPYNIGSLLLINWLYEARHINSMTLMLQKEVVDRIISAPNKKSYGRLSIFYQILCEVEKCFDVSPKAFYPEPKVRSSIVRLTPKSTAPNHHTLNMLGKITGNAFSARRKMIKSSLKHISPHIENILIKLGIDDKLRAENLTPSQFLQIAEEINY